MNIQKNPFTTPFKMLAIEIPDTNVGGVILKYSNNIRAGGNPGKRTVIPTRIRNPIANAQAADMS